MLFGRSHLQQMASPYAPDEPHSSFIQETMWLQGALASNIIYGVQLLLFAMTFRLLVKEMDQSNRKRQIALLIYITILVIFGTLNQFSTAIMTQYSFINYRDFPGGPAEYEVAMYTIPVDEVGIVLWIMGSWFMDALLVWRCIVIFSHMSPSRIARAAIIFPCILSLASVGLGIMFLVKTDGSSPFNDVTMSVPFFASTLALNVIVTIIIVARLLYCRWEFGRVLGRQHSGSYYAFSAAILSESAAVYSVFALCYLVLLATHSPVVAIFSQTLNPVQTFSAILIIYQVAAERSQACNTVVATQAGRRDQSEKAPGLTSIVTLSEPRTTDINVRVSSEVTVDSVAQLV